MSRSGLSLLLRLLLALYFPLLVLMATIAIAIAAYLIYLAIVYEFLLIPLILLLPAAVLLGTVIQAGNLVARWGFQSPGRNPFEVLLPRNEIAGLVEFVTEVATRHGLPVPSHIRFGADTIAHVYEERDGRRILVLGGPAVAGLSQNALAGIIAHELGHFAGGDTRLSRRAYYRHSAMAVLEAHCSRNNAAHLNPLIWLIRLYHLLYRLIRAAHSRQQEFEADRHSKAESGKYAAAATLILLTVAERLPWARLSSLVESRIATNEPLEKAFAEQMRMVQQTTPSDWEDALRKELKTPAELFEDHPALKDRLAALGVSPKKALSLALEQTGPSARDLFADWDTIERMLTDRLLIPFREAYLAKREIAQILLGKPV